jgi:hypothetical protein
MKPDLGERLRGTSAPDLWPDIERRIEGRRPQPFRSALRYAGPVAASLALIAVLAWALTSLNGGLRRDGPATVALTDPDGAAVAGMHAEVRIVPDERVGAYLERHDVRYTNGFVPIPGGSSVVVRLDWTTQPSAPPGSRFVVVVLDKHGPGAAGPGPLWTSPPVTMGWDGRLDEVATRYPWLQSAVDVCDDSGCHAVTTAAFVRAQAPGPLWIVARFPDVGVNHLRAGSAPDPLVGVLLTDGEVNTLWAERVYG